MTVSALSIALGYIKRGWSPVPVPYRQKGPVIKDWQKLRLTRQTARRYFNGTRSISASFSGHRPPTCAMLISTVPRRSPRLRALLPPTARFGRLSTPGAHWLYRVKFPAGTKAVLPSTIRSSSAPTPRRRAWSNCGSAATRAHRPYFPVGA